ncbi:MAG: CBS domain protein [Methanomassiliicoccales archaeon PtaU1.Bin124]|nr:MAG: CBS domain protein [Methanomassiliicoccales archaeon PtaU1.Bin124]
MFVDTLVGDVYDTIVTPSRVKADAPLREVVELMIANPRSRKAYVIDDNGLYIGTVSTETILRLLGYRVGVKDGSGLSFYHFLRDAMKEQVKDVMVRGRTVTKETKLVKALGIMLEDHLNDLPVVDADGKLIGELISLELFIKGRNLFK